nr:MAG TPA: cytochrome C6 [Caudoviricetes sp.]
MVNHAKVKGNSWERECAKLLSKCLGCHFERNKNGSGAFVGGKNSQRMKYLSTTQILSFLGDVIPPDNMTKMCVECKFYKDFPFHHFLIDKEIPLLDDWIQQQLDIVNDTHFWFVAFKINFAGSYIVIPQKLLDNQDITINHSLYHYKNECYIIADFENFIKVYKDFIIKKCQ